MGWGCFRQVDGKLLDRWSCLAWASSEALPGAVVAAPEGAAVRAAALVDEGPLAGAGGATGRAGLGVAGGGGGGG